LAIVQVQYAPRLCEIESILAASAQKKMIMEIKPGYNEVLQMNTGSAAAW